MLSRNQVKLIQSLKQNKFRKQHQLFVAEGPKVVGELLTNGFDIQSIYATKSWIQTWSSNTSSIQVNEISSADLERISHLKNPNQVLAVCHIPSNNQLPSNIYEELVLVLDDIKDPGNLGTIIRIADWFGIDHIICSPETVDIYNPKVVQSTMGSLSRVQLSYQNLEDFIHSAPENCPVYGTLLDGDDIRTSELQEKGLLIIGSESHGISEHLRPLISHRIRIPHFQGKYKAGHAESLNAGIATALSLYELKR